MQVSEIVRVAAAHLNVDDELPIAGLAAAVPHFFIRITAICVERREIGVVRDFLLRGIALGITSVEDLAGFLGIRAQEVFTELATLEEGFYVLRNLPSKTYSLMEKGKAAISVLGLPQATEREAACYVNGITRNIEQFSGELIPKRRIPTGVLVLPAVPARPPRIEELEISGVRTAMFSARNSLPRQLEISRLGRVLRTASLFASGHLLLRRGAHGVPLICINGTADTDLAKPLGAHPALQSIKAMLEKNERHIRLNLSQLQPKLRSATKDKPEEVRLALTRLVAFSDAEDATKENARSEFTQSASILFQSTHWISGLEVQVLFAAAVVNAKQSLLIVAPQFRDTFGFRALECIREAVRRGVKVEMHVSPALRQIIASDDEFKTSFQGVQISPMNSSGEWCGFSADGQYVVIGASRSDNTALGRCEFFFGAILTNEKNPEELLLSQAIKRSAVVTVKPKKRVPIRS
jgi:hypothetical protein